MSLNQKATEQKVYWIGTQADRLKIKYDYMIKSLGGERGDKEEKKSEEGGDKVSSLYKCSKWW